jgi:hypothetical protein
VCSAADCAGGRLSAHLTHTYTRPLA